MAKAMNKTTLILAVLTVILWTADSNRDEGLFLSLAIAASTFLYHFGMRLFVGVVINSVMRNRANYNAAWFRSRKWEARLYQILHVKCWKGRMPTYVPELFDQRKHSLDEIAQAMCQSEIVHEIIAVLSFLPLFTVKYTGALPVFLVTSLFAAAVDLSFVIIQRYNRSRIILLLEKQKNTRQPVLPN